MGLERPRTASKFDIIVQKKLFLEKKTLILVQTCPSNQKKFLHLPEKIIP